MNWTHEALAWMGGFYEGEGCILTPKRNSAIRIRIGVTEGLISAIKHGRNWKDNLCVYT